MLRQRLFSSTPPVTELALKKGDWVVLSKEGITGKVDWVHGDTVAVSFHHHMTSSYKMRYMNLNEVNKV